MKNVKSKSLKLMCGIMFYSKMHGKFIPERDSVNTVILRNLSISNRASESIRIYVLGNSPVRINDFK